MPANTREDTRLARMVRGVIPVSFHHALISSFGLSHRTRQTYTRLFAPRCSVSSRFIGVLASPCIPSDVTTHVSSGETFTVPNYVTIEAPGAIVQGAGPVIQLGSECAVRIKELRVSSGIGVLKPLGSAGTARFEADQVTCTGNAIGGVNLSLGAGAVLMVEVKTTIVEDGYAYGDITTDVGHMHLQCEDIYIAGAGLGVVRTGAGTTEGYVAHILEIGAGVGFGTAIQVAAGDIDLFVHRISANTAVNVAAAGTLRLFYSSLTGAIVGAGTFLSSTPV